MRNVTGRVRRVAAAYACAMASLALLSPARGAAEMAIAYTPSPSALPLDVAFAQGFFAAEGVNVRAVECASGPRCIRELFDGRVQFVAVSELPVVFSSFERADYAIVATLATSTRNIEVIGRKSAGITGPRKLAGRKIGVILGSSSHYFLDAYLLFHGVDPRQVRIVGLQSEQIAGAVERREIDALAGFPRHTGAVARQLGDDAVVLENPRIYTHSYNLVAGRRTLQAHAGDVVKVLRALDRAQRFIAEQPRRAKEMFGARARLDVAHAASIYPGFNFRLSLAQSLVSTMEGQARWALREGHVPAGRAVPNYLDYIDAAPLRKAAPTALAR